MSSEGWKRFARLLIVTLLTIISKQAPSPAEGSAAPSNDIRTPPGGVPSQARSRTEIGKQTPEAKAYQPQQQQSSPKQQRPGEPGYGRLNEREFPLEMGGAPKVSSEKTQQLRPRGVQIFLVDLTYGIYDVCSCVHAIHLLV